MGKPRKPTEFEIEDIKAWLKFGREMRQQSPDTLDKAANTFITVSTSLASVYATAFTVLNLLEKEGAPLWMAALSIVLWAATVILFVRVISPREYKYELDDVEQMKQFVAEASKTKYHRLTWALAMLIIAFTFSMFVLVGGSVFAGGTPVQLVISPENQANFQSLGLSIDQKGWTTQPLTLIKSDDKYYQVRLTDGTKINIKRDWIAGVVYPKQ
ncbi:MAG: hypothetical protein PHO26_00515 [Dehalococcoidia bacterium]|nr:hypothetical protein [Dehalococcoidia bacterium]MDD5494398.1 hypothetical protein [Dehalococcoidia bacterium]